MKKFFQDFKAFAMKGNVIDMAVGVVIGGAFGKIVTSLVNDIITPAISLLTGSVNLADLSVDLTSWTGEPISLAYGLFAQNILDFLLIAFSIFMVIKIIGRIRRKKEEAPAAPPAPPEPSKEEVLLTEIRDLLKEQNKTAKK